MTASNVAQRITFPGDGTADPRTITFQFWDETDLEVWLTTAAGVDSLLVLTTDYTVTGGAGSTGTLVPVAVIASGDTWTLVRTPVLTQDHDYTANDTFPSQSHENALDMRTLADQDLIALAKRSLRIDAIDDPDVALELPKVADRASKYLKFDALGSPTAVEEVDIGAVSITAFMEGLLEDASAALARVTLEAVYNAGGVTSFEVGTNLARPAASTAGAGAVYVENDRLRVSISTGTFWREFSIGTMARLNLLTNGGFHAGRPMVANDSFELFIDNGTTVNQLQHAARGHLAGFVYTHVGDHEAGVGEGECASELVSGVRNFLTHASGMTKLNNATWAAGDTNGGLADALTLSASTWYHYFVLGHTDGVQTDFGWDTDVDATNLQADVAVIAAGFDHSYRRLFSIRTDGSSDLREIFQQGDWFFHADPSDQTIEDETVTATSALYTISRAPLGIRALVKMNVGVQDSIATGLGIAAGDATDINAETTPPYAAGAVPVFDTDAAVNDDGAFQIDVMTDLLSRIRMIVSSGTTTLQIMVLGWMDDRGRYS